MDLLFRFTAIPSPWHAEQMHLAEWQALETREILYNLDLSIEAKNIAKQRAAKHKGLIVENDDDQDPASKDKPRIDTEDIGGIVPDEEDIPCLLYTSPSPRD